MKNTKGKFIVIYGINNLGKTTQAKLLVKKLNKNGIKAEYLKVPIYNLTPSGPILNSYLRDKNPYKLTAREAQIIYALNRTQYQDILKLKLKRGVNIIAEDYSGTGQAWGMGAGVSEKFLKLINSHLLAPDIVFLFDGKRFIKSREANHYHEENEKLIKKVRLAHLKLGREYGWIKINANLSIEKIQDEIWEKIKKIF